MYKMDMRIEYKIGKTQNIVLPFTGRGICMEQRFYDGMMVAHIYKRFSWLSVRRMKTKFIKKAECFQLHECAVNLKLYKYKNTTNYDVCWERDFPRVCTGVVK